MSLLSSGQKADIRAAIKSVTDTFMVTPVVYHLKGESIDRFNEDRTDQANTDYNINGLVEYMQQDSDKVKEMSNGAISHAEVVVTCNLADLKTLGLVNSSNLCIGNDTKDYFTTNGETYKLELIKYDGPLDHQNVLVMIFGNKDKHKS